MRRHRALALWLLLLAGAAPLENGPRPPAVTVVAAQRGVLADWLSLTGTLVPREEALVTPQVDGLAVTAILAEEGDMVAAGQVLARLSREQIDTALAQNTAQIARAQAAVAEAQAASAEAEASRVRADAALACACALVGPGATSREAFEQRRMEADVAAAKVASATAALRAAEADRALALAQRDELAVRLARTELRAPVAGKVSRRTARLGAVVGAASDPLFRIVAGGAVELNALVPEILLARLRPGQQAVVVPPGPGQRSGHVRLVAPEIDQTTRLGRVRIALDDSTGLTVGGFARAKVETERREGVIVPLSAVLFGPTGARVQVVAGGVVATRPVQTGLRAEGRVEITAGLAPGETVVAVSGSFVRDGDRVAAVPES